MKFPVLIKSDSRLYLTGSRHNDCLLDNPRMYHRGSRRTRHHFNNVTGNNVIGGAACRNDHASLDDPRIDRFDLRNAGYFGNLGACRRAHRFSQCPLDDSRIDRFGSPVMGDTDIIRTGKTGCAKRAEQNCTKQHRNSFHLNLLYGLGLTFVPRERPHFTTFPSRMQ